MFELKLLVGEFGSVDGFASSSIVAREVSTLTHESRNDLIERKKNTNVRRDRLEWGYRRDSCLNGSYAME